MKKEENFQISVFHHPAYFSMICIVTFSALAFVTANSDYKLSKHVADNNSSYYRACEKYGMRYHRLMPFLHPPTRAVLIKQHTMRP